MSQETEAFTLEVQIIITLIAAVLTFVSGWALHHLTDYLRRRRQKQSIIRTLLNELEQIDKDLKEHPKPDISEVTPGSGEHRFNFCLLQLQTSAFDILINSEVYHEFDSSIQLKLTRAYNAIKFSNKLYFYLLEALTIRADPTTQFINNMKGQLGMVSNQTDELKGLISETIQALKALQ